MGIFTKTKKVEVVEQPANYNTALDYLIGLSTEDFAKVVRIAEEYRKTDAVAAGILGIKHEPTTFIGEPDFKGKSLDEINLKYEKLPKKSIKIKRGKK